MTTIEFETVRMNGLVTLLHHIENGRVDRGIDEFGAATSGLRLVINRISRYTNRTALEDLVLEAAQERFDALSDSATGTPENG